MDQINTVTRQPLINYHNNNNNNNLNRQDSLINSIKREITKFTNIYNDTLLKKDSVKINNSDTSNFIEKEKEKENKRNHLDEDPFKCNPEDTVISISI